MKRKLQCAAILLAVMFLGMAMTETVSAEASQSITYHRARVVEVLKEQELVTEYSGGAMEHQVQFVRAEILRGPYQGKTVTAEYTLNFGLSDQYQEELLRVNDHVMLFMEYNPDGSIANVFVAEIVRERHLLALLAGFFLLLLLVGGMKGLKAIVALILTVFAILFILIPSLLRGGDPVLLSVLICVFVIALSLLIISGYNRKTFSAIVGTTGGVFIAGLIAVLIGEGAKITGFGADESQMLLFIPQAIPIDFSGLLFAAIIIGSMGATMDMGMTVASAMHEVRENRPDISPLALIRAGMNVGRDAMATMANTLILAYTGGSLHLMLLLMAYNTPFSTIINWNVIAAEILKGLAGSIGIICTVPITALMAGLIERRSRNREGKEQT